MDKNTLNKQWTDINLFLYLSFAMLTILSLISVFNAWILNICGIIAIVILLWFGGKSLKIPAKELLLTKQKKGVSILDGLLLTLLFFTIYNFMGFLYQLLLYGVLKISGSVGIWDSSIILYYAVVGPIVEETIFRVVGLRLFEKAGGRIFSVILTAFFFGLAHISVKVPTTFIAGIAFALLVYLTESVWYAILLHVLTNSYGFVLSFIFPNLNEIHLLLGMVLIMILSLILLLKRPVFRQLIAWGNPKRVVKNIKSNKTYYTQIASSPFFIIIVLSLGVLAFMAIIAQLS